MLFNYAFLPKIFKMKIYTLFLVVLMFVACNNVSEKGKEHEISTDDVSVGNKDNLPILAFDEEEHDFGKIVQGEKISYEFKFTNKGKSNLVISSAAASCGCTVADFPKQPIKPGESSKIKVEFNSENKAGHVEKTITVVSNSEPNTAILRIKTDIVTPQNQQ